MGIPQQRTTGQLHPVICEMCIQLHKIILRIHLCAQNLCLNNKKVSLCFSQFADILKKLLSGLHCENHEEFSGGSSP